MDKFVILPDITCDISEEIRSYFGLEDYLCGHVNIDGEKAKKWISNGAQPTDTVKSLLKKQGII